MAEHCETILNTRKRTFSKPHIAFTTIKLYTIYLSFFPCCHAGLDLASACSFFCKLFQTVMYVVSFPPFVLIQKMGPKNQGKPEPLRASCRPGTATPNFFLHHVFTHNHVARVLSTTTFSKA